MSLYHTSLNGMRLSQKVDHHNVPMYKNLVDGTGRDTYIGDSNGGFTMLHSPSARGITAGAFPNNKFRFSMSKSTNCLLVLFHVLSRYLGLFELPFWIIEES